MMTYREKLNCMARYACLVSEQAQFGELLLESAACRHDPNVACHGRMESHTRDSYTFHLPERCVVLPKIVPRPGVSNVMPCALF